MLPLAFFFLIPPMSFMTILFVESGRNIFLSLPPLVMACFGSDDAKELKSEREVLQEKLRAIVDKVCTSFLLHSETKKLLLNASLCSQLGPQLFADFENTRVIHKEQFEHDQHGEGPNRSPDLSQGKKSKKED